MTETDPNAQPHDLRAAWQRLVDSGGSLLRSRLELAGIELAEEWKRLQRVLLLLLVAAVAALLAIGSFTALLVIALWDRSHWLVLAVLGAAEAGVVAYCLFRLRAALHDAPPPFAATRAELAKDGAMWRSKP
ncbi:MAG: phage holin family protein [Thiomonas sp.]|jgi:uncharacterized membrane protein YqjE